MRWRDYREHLRRHRRLAVTLRQAEAIRDEWADDIDGLAAAFEEFEREWGRGAADVAGSLRAHAERVRAAGMLRLRGKR